MAEQVSQKDLDEFAIQLIARYPKAGRRTRFQNKRLIVRVIDTIETRLRAQARQNVAACGELDNVAILRSLHAGLPVSASARSRACELIDAVRRELDDNGQHKKPRHSL